MHQWVNASAAKSAGVDELTADSFLEPDGILTRMRALACGWTKPGDKLRDPSDRAWWGKRYAFPLWEPLGTYADNIAHVVAAPIDTFSDALAAGDSGELSVALGGMSAEIQELLEAPCPKWLIPPKRGQQPIPNPECARREKIERDRKRDDAKRARDDANKQKGIDIVIWLGVGFLAYLALKKATR